ncbi:CPBP family intramembrane glutamic endopeptidase [Nocardia acidivorans]|uniref:CPBP family intramembrane glutamic endopeptidase n=1 Tax=Nocardia acidivorans TaxID=404580 RepID=UPI0009FC52FF|nr:CPBP family intramembrane glutamic endopeptidase [Nocardia acidivorans]
MISSSNRGISTTAASTPAADGGTRPNRLAERLLDDRHSLPLSIMLHLVPGLLIVTAYLLIGGPFAAAIGYPTLLGWAIALSLVLIPILSGLLLLGRKQNGRFTLHGVLRYTGTPVPRARLVAMVIALIVWQMVVGFALAPVNNFFKAFFTWLPYTDTGGGPAAYLQGYSHSVMLTAMVICLPLTGISLPLIEELYFRGFLLPRLAHLGGWAPVVNSILFAVYHFWSPWMIVSRTIFMFPGSWFTWRKQDIRLSIGMHAGGDLLLAATGTTALALNLL